MKEIALLGSGRGFEKYKCLVKDLHRAVKLKGDALFVMSCYSGQGDEAVPQNDQSIYTLADKRSFDGYMIDDNVSTDFVMKYFFEKGKLYSSPIVMLNLDNNVVPCVQLDSATAADELVEHLISVHGCKKINYVADFDYYSTHYGIFGGLTAYKKTLAKNGIPFEEKRMINTGIGITAGADSWDVILEQKADDCDAILLDNDVLAIGLINRLKELGKKVPEDIKVVTLRRTANSACYKPDISGVNADSYSESSAITELLYEQINGTMIRPAKMYKASAHYGESCGCCNKLSEADMESCRNIVLSIINMGAQISAMMQFNDSLEKVSSLEEYADIINHMFDDLGFESFAICINKNDVAYVLDADSSITYDETNPFGDSAYILTGKDKETDLTGRELETGTLHPFSIEPGDIVIAMPIVHKNRSFGYVAMKNEYLPIEQYNFRICMESLGNSIENLRRQMALKHSLNEMNELRMKDPLTGYYNRASIRSFKDSIVKLDEFTIVMMDMDGLKKVNDEFGHEEGNRAIVILANTINRALHTGDILARYGGDEFVVMSPMDTSEYWEEQKIKLNEKLQEIIETEKLPFKMGVSIGYGVHNQQNNRTIDECFEVADNEMYAHKVSRKACRTD